MQEKKLQPTTPITVRVDIRSVASIVSSMLGSGKRPRSLSGAIREALDTYSEILCNNNLADGFCTEKAREFLMSMNYLSPEKASSKNIVRSISKDSVLSALNEENSYNKMSDVAKILEGKIKNSGETNLEEFKSTMAKLTK